MQYKYYVEIIKVFYNIFKLILFDWKKNMNINKFFVIFLLSNISFSVFANDLISKSPEGTEVYFISPKDGETVSQTFKIRFGLVGMGVAPAGINQDGTGHHHLLINTDIATIDLSKSLPATDKIKHFGKGQTETELTLAKGTHTLQLLLGNYLHIPHDKPVHSKKITITVE